ncbi:MAG TPA: CAP domain-containing protein [Candidatus Hydrogenedentes bacterium]|jgi:hypothetical protein|nr:MAG: Cysteine-rich secretory protein family protein [Candidatus Hydrogenedentes bacterium ADurb.Bin101]HQN01517.1 CAP domain-containing protein [Candidatus Hydrogenedentota bacterium]
MMRCLYAIYVPCVILLVFPALSGCFYIPPESCSLHVSVSPSPIAGTVENTPDASLYYPGDEVEMYARASTGWEFVQWSGIISDSANPITVQCFSDSTITAHFRRILPVNNWETPFEGEEELEGEGQDQLEGEGQDQLEGEGQDQSTSCIEVYPWEWERDGEPYVYAEQLMVWEEDVFQQINALRSQYGLPALFLDTCIARVARGHSRDMAENDYLDHVNLCGENHGARLNDGGVIWKSSGENLGFYPSSDSDPVTPIVNAWMESQSHRKNILTREYTHSGIGIALNDAGGVYITQNFVNY